MKVETQDYHIPVLLQETIDGLDIEDGGIYFDGTLGGGGHSSAILSHSNVKLIASDKDSYAIEYASARLGHYGQRVTFIHSDFKDICETLPDGLSGILLDLGVSSSQIDTTDRGFSYRLDGPLDMRMHRGSSLSAYDIVNGWTQQQLSSIIFRYGQEKFARLISSRIVERREKQPIVSTLELSDIVIDCVPAHLSKGHPAKKTFQAIRIAVNSELEGLDSAIVSMVDKLKLGGRICIITFHSLEDRIVKDTFVTLAQACICDKRLPLCVCNNQPRLKLLARIVPNKQEINSNKRAKSATLRVAQRV